MAATQDATTPCWEEIQKNRRKSKKLRNKTQNIRRKYICLKSGRNSLKDWLYRPPRMTHPAGKKPTRWKNLGNTEIRWKNLGNTPQAGNWNRVRSMEMNLVLAVVVRGGKNSKSGAVDSVLCLFVCVESSATVTEFWSIFKQSCGQSVRNTPRVEV